MQKVLLFVLRTTMKENREGNVEIRLLVSNRISLFYNSIFVEDYRMKNDMTKGFCFAVFCVGTTSVQSDKSSL